MIEVNCKKHRIERECDGAIVKITSVMEESGSAEYHVMITTTLAGESFSRQLDSIVRAYDETAFLLGSRVRPVFKRYFLSDAANQFKSLPTSDECAVSVVEQPPLDGTKIALWAYFVEGAERVPTKSGLNAVAHGNYLHLWQGGACAPDLKSEVATRALLMDYSLKLEDEGCSLADNCARTWFFVHDVDVNYAGVVKGRNEMFKVSGLTKDTHYIASTGINGCHADSRVSVAMDTYSINGLKPGQMGYLYAPEYLNPTYEYGVAFERGTYIDYGDRRHVFISGTASINNRGEVEHKGDIRLQTLRMWKNVGALLNEGGCGWDEVCHMIVYLRDIADYGVVKEMFDTEFPTVPKVIVLAPVCRPEWLIEMECAAVVETETHYDVF